MNAAISLFTPGPTHIPKRVLDAMSIGELHHRTSEFRKVFRDTAEGLRELLHAKEAPLLLTCSGTGGMEAVVSNCMAEQDCLGYLDAGKFGARWGAIAKAKGLGNFPLTLEWGECPTVEQVRGFLTTHPKVTHFAIQYSETSTTVLHNVPAICEMLKAEFPDIFVLIDAISAATTLEIPLDTLHWDGVVLASQKAFMLPPGLSMLFLSDRYIQKCESVDPKTLYFDLKKERSSQAKDNAAWTPAVSVILGLQETLRLFEEEGWKNVYARHAACRERSFEWFEKLGIKPVNADHASPSVSGGFLDENLDVEGLRARLREEKGFRIAGGQDHWKGKVLRFGHMGVVTPEDLDRCFSALQELMSK